MNKILKMLKRRKTLYFRKPLSLLNVWQHKELDLVVLHTQTLNSILQIVMEMDHWDYLWNWIKLLIYICKHQNKIMLLLLIAQLYVMKLVLEQNVTNSELLNSIKRLLHWVIQLPCINLV